MLLLELVGRGAPQYTLQLLRLVAAALRLRLVQLSQPLAGDELLVEVRSAAAAASRRLELLRALQSRRLGGDLRLLRGDELALRGGSLALRLLQRLGTGERLALAPLRASAAPPRRCSSARSHYSCCRSVALLQRAPRGVERVGFAVRLAQRALHARALLGRAHDFGEARLRRRVLLRELGVLLLHALHELAAGSVRLGELRLQGRVRCRVEGKRRVSVGEVDGSRPSIARERETTRPTPAAN